MLLDGISAVGQAVRTLKPDREESKQQGERKSAAESTSLTVSPSTGEILRQIVENKLIDGAFGSHALSFEVMLPMGLS